MFGLHDIRVKEMARMGDRRGRIAANHQESAGTRHQLLRHSGYVLTWRKRRDYRSRAKRLRKRDEIVLATKVFHPMNDKPNQGGLSRKHILAAADDSLR